MQAFFKMENADGIFRMNKATGSFHLQNVHILLSILVEISHF